MIKLCQLLALEKEIKGKAYATLTECNKKVQKASLFTGMTRRYKPLEDEGEKLPPEDVQVQETVHEVLRDVRTALKELFDVTATKDYANTTARANVSVNGTVLIANAPVTYLLFLEKQLNDLRTFVGNLPTLDPAEKWYWTDQGGTFSTNETQTIKTKKQAKAIVLYPATPEHPAQTQMVTEDVTVGHWNVTRVSGAIPRTERAALLRRVDALSQAVKSAREAANATTQRDGLASNAEVFDFLFGQTDD